MTDSESNGAEPIIDIRFRPDDGRYKDPYRHLVLNAVREVRKVFVASSLATGESPLDTVIFMTTRDAVREVISAAFQVLPDDVPDTLAGTPKGKTLYMATENIVEPALQRLYPEIPWDGTHEYYECIKHEIAHMFHEAAAIQLTGTADGMGPPWFFEGLAIAVAGQFPVMADEPPLTVAQMLEIIENSRHRQVSYTAFARIAYSLRKRYGLRELVVAAGIDNELKNLLDKY